MFWYCWLRDLERAQAVAETFAGTSSLQIPFKEAFADQLPRSAVGRHVELSLLQDLSQLQSATHSAHTVPGAFTQWYWACHSVPVQLSDSCCWLAKPVLGLHCSLAPPSAKVFPPLPHFLQILVYPSRYPVLCCGSVPALSVPSTFWGSACVRSGWESNTD